jgi:hypothetical protein
MPMQRHWWKPDPPVVITGGESWYAVTSLED